MTVGTLFVTEFSISGAGGSYVIDESLDSTTSVDLSGTALAGEIWTLVLNDASATTYGYEVSDTDGSVDTLDEVAKHLAEKISEKDRQIFFRLKANGHYMMIISCGTLDLSERILKVAGVDKCFELIEGNRFQIENNKIVGMDMFVPTPEDKLKLISAQGVFPEQSVVVGDGYTDLPLLDRAGLPVMIVGNTGFGC